MSFHASSDLALSHAEVRSALAAEGATTTFFVQGAPGIGKSALLTSFDPDTYMPVMVDCPNFEPGDLMVPVISEDKTTVKYAINELLQLSQGKALVMCLDELAKASPSVQASLLPLIYERRLGSTHLPEGSIVFATSNEDEDNVGDVMHAHAWNRMCSVTLRSPTHNEWVEWAAASNVAPEIVAFAQAYPMMFEHYSNPGAESNPYVFNPKTGVTRSYVSPRSLARCTPTVNARREGALSDRTAAAVIAGKIGQAAAAELATYMAVGMQMPTAVEVAADPDGSKARMSKLSTSAYFVLAVSLAQAVSKDNAVAFTEFLHSANEEALSLFLVLASKNPQAFMAFSSSPRLKPIIADLARLRTLRV